MVAWAVVAQVGAEALAKGLGSSIGEGLGTAFVGWLTGAGGGGIDWREVDSRLERLEQKINALSEFITEDLPEVVYIEALHANLAIIKAQTSAHRSAVFGALASFLSSQNPNSANNLRNAAVALLDTAETLMMFGSPAYPIALEALCAATTAYGALINYQEAQFRPELQVRADRWANIVGPWLENTDGSLKRTLANYEAEYAAAKNVLNSYPNGVPFFLLSVSEPNTIEKATQPAGSIWANMQEDIIHFYDIWIGFLDRKTSDGTWTGGPGEVFWQQHAIVNAPPLPVGQWQALCVRSPSSSGQLPIQVDWWQPLRTWPAGYSKDDVRNMAGRKYTHYHNAIPKLAPLIVETRVVLERIGALYKACVELAK